MVKPDLVLSTIQPIKTYSLYAGSECLQYLLSLNGMSSALFGKIDG